MLPSNDTWDDESIWLWLPLASFRLRPRITFEFSTNLAALPRVFSRMLSMSGSVVTSGSAGGAGGAGGAGETCAEGVAVADIGFEGFAVTDVADGVGFRGRSFFTLSISGCLGVPMVDDGANDVGGVGRNSGV